MSEKPTEAPPRRMRVQYLYWHNPPVWAAYYEPPGRVLCYCHAPTLSTMWAILRAYFAGAGYCSPQKVDAHFLDRRALSERSKA